jgi:hypothetical protein
MSTSASNEIPNDLIAALAEAATDLLHFGTLSSYAEVFALDRASFGRSANEAETSIESRIESEQSRPLAAVDLVRSVAEQFPEAFNASIATTLSRSSLEPAHRDRFDSATGVKSGNYAEAALAICDRVEPALRRGESGGAPRSDSTPPPVSGGDQETGCGMIAIGSMAGGAACVIGCAPCCPVAAAGGLILLGLCS